MGDVDELSKIIRTNINNIFRFPKYSNNIESAFTTLIESCKTFISEMVNLADSHGQFKSNYIKFNTNI